MDGTWICLESKIMCIFLLLMDIAVCCIVMWCVVAAMLGAWVGVCWVLGLAVDDVYVGRVVAVWQTGAAGWMAGQRRGSCWF